MIKRIGIGLGIAAFVLFVGFYFLPDHFEVSREIVVEGDAGYIQAELDNFHHWNEHWSPWVKMDPGMSIRYDGPERGAGAFMHWKGNESGEGELKVLYSTEDSVGYSMHMLDFGVKSVGKFELIPQGNATKVVWTNVGKLAFWERPFGLFMDGMMGPDFEKGLVQIKQLVEGQPKVKKEEEKQAMVVEEKDFSPKQALLISIKCTEKEIGEKLSAAYRDILAYMKQEHIRMEGPTFAIYHRFSAAQIQVDAGMPIDRPVLGHKRIFYKSFEKVRSAQCLYRGDFAKTSAAHARIAIWMKEQNKRQKSAVWEVYLTDPDVVKDTAKLETLVVYPLE